MFGRPRLRRRLVSPLNVIILLLLLGPTYVVALYYLDAYEIADRPSAAGQYFVPEGAAGFVKVMEHHGITFHGKDSMNVMVLGIDLNWTDSTHLPYSKGARSDTMFVLNLHRDGSRVGMLTIPRDMYVDLPDHNGHDKINGAYAIGDVPMAKKAIEQFLGIHIDHYLVLRIAGAKKLVDALGGVNLTVEKNMDYDDNWGDLHVHLKKGYQHLDGTQTVAYARFRHDEESDFGRIRRQQQVVDTLIKQLKDPANFANPEKLREFAQIFKEYVETDFKTAEMLDVGWVYRSFDRQNFIKGFIPGDDGMVGDMSVLYPPDHKTIRTLVHKILLANAVGLDPADVSVEVLNGSTVHMGATELGNKLTDRGFNVVRLADWSGDPPARSVVVLHADAVPVDTPEPTPSSQASASPLSPSASPSSSPSASASLNPSASPSGSPSTSPRDRALKAVTTLAQKLVPGLTVVTDDQIPDLATQKSPKGTMITVILGPDWQRPGTAISESPLPSEAPRATVTMLPGEAPSASPSPSP